MPVHNGEPYLQAAVDSILKQTFQNFEFLIVDDGSKDRSTDLIRSYSDSRIILIQNEQNLGTVHALNQGIISAKGEYIVRMDCDDISLPERIEHLVKFMNCNHDVGVAGSAMRLIKKGKLKNTRYQPDSDEELKITLLFNTCFFHPTVIMRSSLVKDHPYPENLVYTQDYNYWTQIAKHTRFANLDNTLLYFREHSGQTSNRKKETQRLNARKVRAEYLQTIVGNINPEDLEIHHQISENKTDIDLLKAKEWLEHLVTLNKEGLSFNNEVFMKMIARKWWLSCRKRSKPKKEDYLIYKSSFLTKFYQPKITGKIKYYYRTHLLN